MKLLLFIAAPLSLGLACCENKAPVSAGISREQAVDLASGAAQEAFTQLSGELSKAIGNGGPVAAIPVCSTKAMPVVSEVAARRGMEMVRLSDRPRNPEQAAAGEDLAAIETFRTLIKRGEKPTPLAAQGADGSITVRLPVIVSQPLCLQCHGSENEITAETREAIVSIYPNDRATGYQLGDLRGIWKITVPPGTPE